MSEFKGTPGPWVASDHYYDVTTVIDGNGLQVVKAERCAVLQGWDEKGFKHWADSEEAHRWLSADEQTANAKLIAAAPELLEACLRIQAQLRQAGITSVAGSLNPAQDSAAQIDSAILKALGE